MTRAEYERIVQAISKEVRASEPRENLAAELMKVQAQTRLEEVASMPIANQMRQSYSI